MNDTLQSLCLDLVHSNVYANFSQNISKGSRDGASFTFLQDPHVRYILSWRLSHENISTAIFPLLLIQEEQLSVTGERKCTKYW